MSLFHKNTKPAQKVITLTMSPATGMVAIPTVQSNGLNFFLAFPLEPVFAAAASGTAVVVVLETGERASTPFLTLLNNRRASFVHRLELPLTLCKTYLAFSIFRRKLIGSLRICPSPVFFGAAAAARPRQPGSKSRRVARYGNKSPTT
jgi:hypothetical protein